MNLSRRFSIPLAAVISIMCVDRVAAQQPQSGQDVLPASQGNAANATNESATDEISRPATTTFFGDTGLWYVPTAEVLASGKWSVSGYRRGTNYTEGFTNVGDFAGTLAVGIAGRAEIFGSFLFDTRVDRNLLPLFNSNPQIGGIVAGYPTVTSGWSGDKLGDLYVGAKVNLLSQSRQNPLAMALRGIVKAPTGDASAGVSTGKTDVLFDFIVSGETAKHLELSSYLGYEVLGKPAGIDSPSGAFRWGAGSSFPSRARLRVILELNGLIPSASTVTITGAPIIGVDGSIAPLVSDAEKLTTATAGLDWQMRNGFFLGTGVSWNVPMQSRNGFTTVDNNVNQLRDFVDWQVRLGYHPGVHVYVAPLPPPPPPPPPPPQVAQNRPPTVRAQCDPCTVEIGGVSTVTAIATDPDGDVLTYRWTAPTGTLANPADRQTRWTAPQQEGPVPVTVTVDDGKGGTASDTVTIQVTRPPVKNYTFEDVHFDFDRYSLRPEATRILDEAVQALREDTTLRVTIEGHTCNIGTAEYNLALGDRRAHAVRDYLLSRGVSADRLTTVSYGEERPKYDNAREETRRLNRRAALVVRLQ